MLYLLACMLVYFVGVTQSLVEAQKTKGDWVQGIGRIFSPLFLAFVIAWPISIPGWLYFKFSKVTFVPE